MSALLLIRLLKLLATVLLVAGVHGAIGHADPAARRRAAFRLATPGLVLAWVLGYAALKATGRTLHEPFVLVGMLGSLGALHAAVGAATRPVGGPVRRLVAVGGLTTAAAAMVLRDVGASAWPAAAVAIALACVLWWYALPTEAPATSDAALARDTATWFRTIAHLEGGSLLFMLGVAIPLRAALGVELDGGEGHIGWFHGTLVFVYVSALLVARRTLGWTWARTALGFVTGMLPFGTFWFVRHVDRT